MTEAAVARAEVVETLSALEKVFEELVVRGLRSSGPDDVARLAQMGQALEQAGATYVAAAIADVVRATREQSKTAARALLKAQTTVRVFERCLSLDAAGEALGESSAGEVQAAQRPVGKEPRENPVPIDAKAVAPVLEELSEVIEGLVASGMTTASAATKQKLDATFKEASRLRLLRLAAALRYINDECARFVASSPQFSGKRLAFFCNRAWVIARGLLDAMARDDRAAIAKLLWVAAPQPVKQLSLIVLGVQKRGLADGSAAFEFRMRVSSGLPRGTKLSWSCVFGARPNVPPEAFLHLPQPQKFHPKILLEPTAIVVTDAAVSDGRLLLGPKSTVTAGPKLKPKAWDEWLAWDPAAAAARVRAHAISPLDLEVELHEEVALDDWMIGAPSDSHRADQVVYPLTSGGRTFHAIAPAGADGEALREALGSKKTKGPLFGVMHYERGHLVFQPLATVGPKGPTQLMISSDKIDLAALMKSLDFST